MQRSSRRVYAIAHSRASAFRSQSGSAKILGDGFEGNAGDGLEATQVRVSAQSIGRSASLHYVSIGRLASLSQIDTFVLLNNL